MHGFRSKEHSQRSNCDDDTNASSVLSFESKGTYYIGGGNGNAIVEDVMNHLGWKRIKEKTDDNCKLRWCELKSTIDYERFIEGQHMVNHIPNCNLLTNKLGLLNSLQDYDRICTSMKKKIMKLDFIPETYRLDSSKDHELFVTQYKENEIWICKPTSRNQGKGIFLVRSLSELEQAMTEAVDSRSKSGQRQTSSKPLNRIIQRYIANPLLIEGHKFDIRCYMLIASTVPYLVLYHEGYIRLSMYLYDKDSDNLIAHLTNQFIQKKDPRYSEVKEETAWSMDRFNQYINDKFAETKKIQHDWALTTLPTIMKQIMTHLIMAVKHKLQCKVGYFELYGLDFMIDEDFKVWLIEVNINPCLATNCTALKNVVPAVVQESLHLAVECFEKARINGSLLPLTSLKEFQILYYSSKKNKNADAQPTTSVVGSRLYKGESAKLLNRRKPSEK